MCVVSFSNKSVEKVSQSFLNGSQLTSFLVGLHLPYGHKLVRGIEVVLQCPYGPADKEPLYFVTG